MVAEVVVDAVGEVVAVMEVVVELEVQAEGVLEALEECESCKPWKTHH